MRRFLTLLSVILMFAVALPAAAEDGLKGWEEGSEYDQLYIASERDSFKGTVLDVFEIVPMEGMAPGYAMTVLEKGSEDERITVHLGPKAFVEERMAFLKRDTYVKVYGCWTELDGEDVFILAKVKKGDIAQMKVRLTSSGKPFWSMSAEELAKEEAE